ncbi:MAG: aldehyde ferredoxin oxidoreductase family protein [Bacteroidales bacterium]
MSSLPTGTMGRVLEVDLASRTAHSHALDPRLAELFVGGRGLGTALLVERFLRLRDRHANPFRAVEPLSPENPLVIATSPANGTSVPTSARFHANFKSPLTGGIGSTNSGGRWGVEFKRTGHDALVLTGRSAAPVVLFVDADTVRFDAPPDGDLDDVEAVTDALERRYGAGVRVMTVGAAGRRLARIASIMNDKGRALGRGGPGAVFGSKNLVAIAVAGSVAVDTAVPDALRPKNVAGSVYKAHAKLRVGKLTKPPEQFGVLPTMGTAGLLGMLAQYDELVHCNFRDTCHEHERVERIGGEALASHPAIKVRRRACYQCPIACTRETELIDKCGVVVDRGEGPEFETVALFGANLDIYDLEPITEANYVCNRLGLDTISAGGTLSALMEIFETARSKPPQARTEGERTLMTEVAEFAHAHAPAQPDSMAPAFGNATALVPLVRAMARGEGSLGRAMASGARRLAERYGHPEAAMTVKGMEIPAYDPRATWTQAMSYMITARGGCHLQGGYSAPIAFCAGYGEFPGVKSEGAALVARNAAYHNTAYDVLGVCAFGGFSVTLDEYANMLNDVTGRGMKASDLETISRRVLTLERLFNLLCGFTVEDDWLPSRFFNEPIVVEGRATVCPEEEFRAMRAEYYESLGWDDRGVPRTATMEELAIDEIVAVREFERMAGLDTAHRTAHGPEVLP